MKTGIRLPAASLLLTMPLAAFADTIPHVPEIVILGGSAFGGGFIGALLACWLCNRRRSRDGSDSRKY